MVPIIFLGLTAASMYGAAQTADQKTPAQQPVTGCLQKGLVPEDFFIAANNHHWELYQDSNVSLADHVGQTVAVTGIFNPTLIGSTGGKKPTLRKEGNRREEARRLSGIQPEGGSSGAVTSKLAGGAWPTQAPSILVGQVGPEADFVSGHRATRPSRSSASRYLAYERQNCVNKRIWDDHIDRSNSFKLFEFLRVARFREQRITHGETGTHALANLSNSTTFNQIPLRPSAFSATAL